MINTDNNMSIIAIILSVCGLLLALLYINWCTSLIVLINYVLGVLFVIVTIKALCFNH